MSDQNTVKVEIGFGALSAIFLVINIVFLLVFWNESCDTNLLLYIGIEVVISCLYLIFQGANVVFILKSMYSMSVIVQLLEIILLIFCLAWYIYGWYLITHTKDCRELMPHVWNLILAELIIPLAIIGLLFIIIFIFLCGMLCIMRMSSERNREMSERINTQMSYLLNRPYQSVPERV